jgi:hypothetical protein
MKSALALLFFLAITLPTAALAAASEWVTVKGGAVRLITAGPPENGTYWAGLEFQLEPGWHTYWRYPGEAGIPPQIAWTATSNIKDKDSSVPGSGAVQRWVLGLHRLPRRHYSAAENYAGRCLKARADFAGAVFWRLQGHLRTGRGNLVPST